MLNHERLNKTLRSDLRTNKHYRKIQQYLNHPKDLVTMRLKEYIEALTEIYNGHFTFAVTKGPLYYQCK